MNSQACNYVPWATIDDGSCLNTTIYDATCGCINDFDNDGICDEDEIIACGDPIACNYNPHVTDARTTICTGSYNLGDTLPNDCCVYTDAKYEACTKICKNDADNDGICDEDEITTCENTTACNYGSPGACTFAQPNLLCNGSCITPQPCTPDVCTHETISMYEDRLCSVFNNDGVTKIQCVGTQLDNTIDHKEISIPNVQGVSVGGTFDCAITRK